MSEPKMEILKKHQIMLENLFNKNQLIPRLIYEFSTSKEFDFVEHIKANRIPVQFGLQVLVQMALHKRTSLPVMVGIMRPYEANVHSTVEMLKRCAEADLMDWNDALEQFIVKFTLSDDVQEELDRYQYPLPMVVPPLQVRTNRDSGYLLTSGSVILRKNHHNDDVCLDHINRLNKIKLCINHDTATMIKNKWKGLDKVQPGETKADFDKRKRAFQKYDRVAKDVIDLLIKEGNEFYLTHKYDKRGRTYCQGHHVTYQGTPWNKAVIEFANKEVVQA